MSANGADRVYTPKVPTRSTCVQKGFRVNKGFLDKSDYDGLLSTKENVYYSIKGLIEGDIDECLIRETCLRGQRNGNIAVRYDCVEVFKSLQCLSHKRVIHEDGTTSVYIAFLILHREDVGRIRQMVSRLYSLLFSNPSNAILHPSYGRCTCLNFSLYWKNCYILSYKRDPILL
jgi:hypothetical protein